MQTNGSLKKGRGVRVPSRSESQLAPGFVDELGAIPNADRLVGCLQCGTCSSACPMIEYMDYTPRRVMAMTRAGYRDEVLGSVSIWACTSCYACTISCPKEIPVTDIMHGLRRIAFREKKYPKHFSTPIQAREMVAMTRKFGRSTESWLAVRLYMRTNPMELLKHTSLGMKLMWRGRMGVKHESVRQREQLAKMLQAAATDARGESS